MSESGSVHRWVALASGLACSSLLVVVAAAQQPELPAMCTALERPNRARHFIARADLLPPGSPVEGDGLLALVHRGPTGALAPNYAPRDLVDLATSRPASWWECTPPRRQCLRRAAAVGYQRLEEAMRSAGLRPQLTSAFRAYRVQCTTFLRWATRGRGGYCTATAASALPGHSQHQLGTTFDLFTRDWTAGGDKFRAGFGCSPGGRWLAEHAHEYGFVLPYPLHPDYRDPARPCRAVEEGEARLDPRTGYRYEPWHLRYIGETDARAYHAAWLESASRNEGEITLGQWLRARRGEAEHHIDAPVCDGCNCDRCATFASPGDGPCEAPAMRLSADGSPAEAGDRPRILSTELERRGDTVELIARLDVSPNTLTQPPVVTAASGASFRRGSREVRLPGLPSRLFPARPGTWRLVIGFGGSGGWPWGVGLAAAARDGTANGANLRFPAPPGELELRVPMQGVSAGTRVRVALASGDQVGASRSLVAPP